MKKTLLNGILSVGVIIISLSMAKGQQWTGSTTTSGNLSRTGNVGIGISIPTQTLDVFGNGRFKTLSLGNNFAGVFLGFNTDQNQSSTYENGFCAQIYVDKTVGSFYFRTHATAGTTTSGSIPASDLRYPLVITRNGNTFIGGGNSNVPSTAVAKLQVLGSVMIGDAPNAIPFPATSGCSSTQPLMLLVNGVAGAKEFRCSLTNWCDYVFEPGYKLQSLKDVEKYIQTNKHLPEVPSEQDVVENGMAMGEMMKVHMKKIEELTLYMIELQKQNERLAAEVASLKK